MKKSPVTAATTRSPSRLPKQPWPTPCSICTLPAATPAPSRPSRCVQQRPLPERRAPGLDLARPEQQNHHLRQHQRTPFRPRQGHADNAAAALPDRIATHGQTRPTQGQPATAALSHHRHRLRPAATQPRRAANHPRHRPQHWHTPTIKPRPTSELARPVRPHPLGASAMPTMPAMPTITKPAHRNPGFTLIELLVTLCITGILALSAYPLYRTAVLK